MVTAMHMIIGIVMADMGIHTNTRKDRSGEPDSGN